MGIAASMDGNYFTEASISFDFWNCLLVIGSGLLPGVYVSCMVLGSKSGSRRMEGICEYSSSRNELNLVVDGHGREVGDLGKALTDAVWILMTTSLIFKLQFF